MKKIIALAVAFVAVAVIGSDANAQSYNQGYQFGAGINASGFGGFGSNSFFGRGSINRQERPPYFAEFPPVYYNGIVRRPYGISPYAAPAGIVPVELRAGAVPTEPAHVRNPFFDQKHAAPVSVVEEASQEDLKSTKNKSTKNKSSRIVNPFFGIEQNQFAEMEPGSILQASFEDEN